MENKLTAIAKDNTMRVSALKLANVARSIVNLKVNKAINQLKFSQKRISTNVLKVLNAAIANAENNLQLDIDNLFVKEAYVGKALSMKRFRKKLSTEYRTVRNSSEPSEIQVGIQASYFFFCEII